MTDRANDSQDCWYIRVPKSRCPEPNFHFFQQVGLAWEDDEGDRYYDIGEIIGIKYTVKDNHPGEWTYLIRYLKCDFDSFLNGSEDGYFEPESRLVADNTVLEEGQ